MPFGSSCPIPGMPIISSPWAIWAATSPRKNSCSSVPRFATTKWIAWPAFAVRAGGPMRRSSVSFTSTTVGPVEAAVGESVAGLPAPHAATSTTRAGNRIRGARPSIRFLLHREQQAEAHGHDGDREDDLHRVAMVPVPASEGSQDAPVRDEEKDRDERHE